MLLTVKTLQKHAAAALCLAALGAVSACSSWRFDGNGGAAHQPAALPPSGAPLSQVSQSELPPPGGAEGQMSAAEAAEPSGALDLTPAGVAGVWRADLGGMSCQLATPQTKAGKGYRAGAIHCPSAFAQLGSWNVSGRRLLFFDKSGNSLATLYSTGSGSFSGRTKTGMPVSLSR